MSGSDEFTIYGGVDWTLTAKATSSPNHQSLKVSLDQEHLCTFEGSGGQPMTLQGTTGTEKKIPNELKARLVSWSFDGEKISPLDISASAGPIYDGPLTATPAQPTENNPTIFTLPANTVAQISAICASNRQEYVEVGVITKPTTRFQGNQKDAVMVIGKDAKKPLTYTEMGPFENETQIVALFTYSSFWPEYIGSSAVGPHINSGGPTPLTTIPSRNSMLINCVPPWWPIPWCPYPASTKKTPSGQYPVGEYTVGKQPAGRSPPSVPSVAAPAGGKQPIIEDPNKKMSWWWCPPQQFDGIGSLLNIIEKPKVVPQ